VRACTARTKGYADSLIKAAETAWAAAIRHPDVYAPASDGASGGGPYDDSDVTDEVYWAAAELYLTTGDSQFKDYLVASPLTTADVFAASVVEGADALLAVQKNQGFGQALATESESTDYLLGRNSLNQSYITGYGTVFSENQHSGWYAAQLDSRFPHPPAGAIAGGPNAVASTWDPTFAALYPDKDCAPQRCYVDDIQSWSTNEITINWNSALGWVTTFLAAPQAPVVEGDGSGGTGSTLWVIVTLGVLLAAALLWWILRRRGVDAPEEPSEDTAPTTPADEESAVEKQAAVKKSAPIEKSVPTKKSKD